MNAGRITLRYAIPLAILTLGLIALGAMLVDNTRYAIKEIEFNSELTLRSLATLTTGSLEAAYRAGDDNQARAAIERLAGHRRIRNAMMIDPEGNIEHATQVRRLSRSLSDIDHDLPEALISHTQAAQSVEIVHDRDRAIIFGAFPVRMPETAEGFGPAGTGWLLMEFDLSATMAAVRQQLITRIGSGALLLLVFCIIFYLFLRHVVLTRIDRLRASVRAVANGDFGALPDIGGSDEISDLAKDFRAMAGDLQRYQDRFQALSNRDILTGLFNRNGLEQRIAKALVLAQDTDRSWLLCNFDVEGMKVINSTRGHAAGDALLRQISDHLKSEISTQATPARISGDEFALLLPLRDHQPEVLARQVLAMLESIRFHWEGASYSVRFNLGAAVIDGSVKDLETATSLANAARLAVKEASQDRVRIGREDDPDLDLSTRPMHWANAVSAALEADRFELFAQEIRANRDSSSSGLFFEILVRLRQPDGKLISPGLFLPAAERYRLAGQVDLWVLNKLFEFFRSHGRQSRQIFMCSINLSGLSLGSEGIINLVSEELERGTIRADQLCFEITETAAITNLSAASGFIKRLRGLGCRFALDDFGSGVSSFGYLKSLDVDYIKIDGMFVRGIADDPTDQAIVRSINDIGHETGKKTIAEFVETDGMAKVLQKIGVDYIQGYWVGRPMALERLVRRLRDAQHTATG